MNLFYFIWQERGNRISLWSALALIAVTWSGFKLLYPHPNIIFDSYNYMKAAALNWSINSWPIGYSKFLQLFTTVSHSAGLLLTFQYVFLELTCLLFFFNWLYLFKPGKAIRIVVFILFFVNPLFLYCSNYILSDALFIGLSILWILQLMWVIIRPSPWMIVTHALLLAVAFTIRYNALYYPFVAALAFLLSRQKVWLKLAGIILPIILVGGFIYFTSSKVAQVTGKGQFSAFGGWKLANDALYVYEHMDLDKTDPVPERFRGIDSMVRIYFRGKHEPFDLLTPDFTSGSYFMFALNSPLVSYMRNQYGQDYPFLNTKAWLTVGPLYQDYGLYLMRKYPAGFTQYFLWPNFLRYATPPGEIFGSDVSFSLHESYGGPYLRKLFGVTDITTKRSAIDLSITILDLYPVFFAVIHFAFVIGFFAFLFCRGFRLVGKPANYCILLTFFLWLCDFGFSVTSAGIVLRYQIFVMIVEMAFGTYFIEFAYRHLDRSASDRSIVSISDL